MGGMPFLIQDNAKLFEVLQKHFPNYKKTKLKQMLKYGSVTVNGTVTTAFHHALKPGDHVGILDKQSARREALKTQLSFPIVYEDNWLVVIDKPEGFLTMGTDRDKQHTVYYELTDYVRNQSPEGHGRIFIVHRLDRDASGLLVFAKRETVKRALQEHWSEAVKKYYAVTEGTPEKRSGVLESYLAEDKFRRVYSVSKGATGAKQASTRYEVLRANARFALLRVTLLTGRKNQIRVHLSDSGHPIAGDEKYGGHPSPAGRLGLHAYFLSFSHPETKEVKTFKTEIPEFISKLVP